MAYDFNLKFLIRSFSFKIKDLNTSMHYFDCMCAFKVLANMYLFWYYTYY